MKKSTRKQFLSLGIGAAASALLIPPSLLAQDRGRPEQLPPEIVKKFVGASHGNLPVVKELLAEHPTLIYASWDWGGGDFESCIGAAGHVGNREMAQFLIEKGARANLFTLCMLGELALLKPILKAYPAWATAIGPHGFTMLHHAIKGGEQAEGVRELLESLGAKETQVKLS
ncbi:MAG: ankyrin repeat domain-containing protein [Bacteroidota bacterium]